MEKRRRTGMYLAGAAVVVLLIAWLTVVQVSKHRLITELGNRDLKVRVEAARQLLEADKLEDSLAGLPIYKRSYTAQALGEIQTDQSTRVLGTLLRDQEEAPQRWAADALIKHGKRAIPVLMAALSAGGGTTDNAVRALVAMGKDAGPRLRFLLADRGSYGAAATALAKIGGVGEQALDVGAYCADDKLRSASISNLAAQKRASTLQCALDNLDEKADKVDRVDDAIAALGVIGKREGTTALLPFLTTDKKTATATSLGLIGDPRAVEPLLAQIPKGSPGYRNAAILALSRIGEPAGPSLMRELKSSDVVMRRAAARALDGNHTAPATSALMVALTDADAGVRAPAAKALGWIDNLTAVDTLVKALSDKNWQVVDAAETALGDIGPGAINKLLAAVAAPGQTTTVRFQISRAFQTMGRGAVPQLIAALSSPNVEVQKWSATSLGGIQDQRAVAALKQLGRTSSGDVRWVVEEQLRVLTGSTEF